MKFCLDFCSQQTDTIPVEIGNDKQKEQKDEYAKTIWQVLFHDSGSGSFVYVELPVTYRLSADDAGSINIAIIKFHAEEVVRRYSDTVRIALQGKFLSRDLRQPEFG